VAKRKITAKEIMADLKSGLDDPALMKKYNLSSEGLQSLFKKMLKAGVVTRQDLDSRTPALEKTVELGLFICPACGNIEHTEFNKCPKCGFAAPEYMKTPDYGDQDNPQKPLKMRGSKGAKTGAPKRSNRVKSAQPERANESRPQGAPTPSANQTGQLKIMGIASIVAYILFFLMLIIFMAILSSKGAVSLTAAIVGVLILQVPAAALIATMFMAFRALAKES
jgi:hypothetical protein